MKRSFCLQLCRPDDITPDVGFSSLRNMGWERVWLCLISRKHWLVPPCHSASTQKPDMVSEKALKQRKAHLLCFFKSHILKRINNSSFRSFVWIDKNVLKLIREQKKLATLLLYFFVNNKNAAHVGLALLVLLFSESHQSVPRRRGPLSSVSVLFTLIWNSSVKGDSSCRLVALCYRSWHSGDR